MYDGSPEMNQKGLDSTESVQKRPTTSVISDVCSRRAILIGVDSLRDIESIGGKGPLPPSLVVI